MIFSVEIFRKKEKIYECILILVIYFKKTGLLNTKTGLLHTKTGLLHTKTGL
jgi:hypothetical protein